LLTIASPSIRQRQRRDGCNDQGKPIGEIVSVPSVEPHALGVALRQDAKTVVLDLVEPIGAGRRGFGRRGEAGLDEAGYSAATL
jgi:hypothetical protein